MGEWCLGVTLARHEDDDDDADCSDWQLTLPSSSPAWEAKAKVPPSQQARLPVWPARLPCQAAGGGPPQKCHALVGMVLGDPSPSPPRRRRRSHPPPRRGPRTCARDSPPRPRESPLTHHSSGPRAHLPRPVRCACVSPTSTTTTTTILGRTAPCRAPNQTSPAQRPSQVGGPVCRTHPFQSRPSPPPSLRTNVRSTRRASTKGGKKTLRRRAARSCERMYLPSPVLSCPALSPHVKEPRTLLPVPPLGHPRYVLNRTRRSHAAARRSIGHPASQPASRPPTRQHARTHARHNLPKSPACTHSR